MGDRDNIHNDLINLGDLPDHLVESILKACESPADLKQLRLVSSRMHSLVAVAIRNLSLHCEYVGSSLCTLHKRFPRVMQLELSFDSSPSSSNNNAGLAQVQEAFSSFWTSEGDDPNLSSEQLLSSDDDVPLSILSAFLTQSLPNLHCLTSLTLRGDMDSDEVGSLIKNLPNSCNLLSLPHCTLCYEKLHQFCLERTNLQISLVGQKTLYDTTSVFKSLSSLSSSIISTEWTLMTNSDVGPLLSELESVKSISLSWPCSGSVSQVAESCESLLKFTSVSKAALDHLTSLSLYSFLGSVPLLLTSLAHLPQLRRLDIFRFNVNQYLSIPNLRLIHQHLPLLYHLGSNGIDLTLENELPPPDEDLPNQDLDQSPFHLPSIKSIEIGISVTGQGRMRDVFPNLETAQMRWSWSALTRKIAGLFLLTDLSIACPEYLADFRLLRTLPILKRFKLSKGSGLSVIISALEALSESKIEEFTLVEWISSAFDLHQDSDRLFHIAISLNHLHMISLSQLTPDLAEIMVRVLSCLKSLRRVKLGWEMWDLQILPTQLSPKLDISFQHFD